MDAVFRRIPEALQAQVPRTVADFIRNTADFIRNTADFIRNTADFIRNTADFIRNTAGDDADEAHRAKRVLGRHGMYVGPYTREMADVIGVVIANVSDGMARLLAGSRWTAEPGKDNAPWAQIGKRLAQAHGGEETPKKSWRFADTVSRGAWVPIAAYLPEDDHE